MEINRRIDRAREICPLGELKKKTRWSFAAFVQNRVKLKAIERKINGMFQLSSMGWKWTVEQFFAKFALTVIQSGRTCTIDLPFWRRMRRFIEREWGNPDSFFIVRLSNSFLSVRHAAGHEGWIHAFSPCTPKMTWPLLDRVGACKRFQILTVCRARLIVHSFVQLSSKWRIRLKPCFISRRDYLNATLETKWIYRRWDLIKNPIEGTEKTHFHNRKISMWI